MLRTSARLPSTAWCGAQSHICRPALHCNLTLAGQHSTSLLHLHLNEHVLVAIWVYHVWMAHWCVCVCGGGSTDYHHSASILRSGPSTPYGHRPNWLRTATKPELRVPPLLSGWWRIMSAAHPCTTRFSSLSHSLSHFFSCLHVCVRGGALTPLAHPRRRTPALCSHVLVRPSLSHTRARRQRAWSARTRSCGV